MVDYKKKFPVPEDIQTKLFTDRAKQNVLEEVTLPGITRLTSKFLMKPVRGACQEMYDDLYRCQSIVGVHRTSQACPEAYHDYLECRYGVLTEHRFKAMQMERVRQEKPFVPVIAPEMISLTRDLLLV